MTKGIIVLDMPERCKNCDFIRENFHGACCERKSDEEGLCKKIPIEIIRHGKPYWCPIKEIPVRLEELKCPHSMSDYQRKGFSRGWNACLDEIEGSAEK